MVIGYCFNMSANEIEVVKGGELTENSQQQFEDDDFANLIDDAAPRYPSPPKSSKVHRAEDEVKDYLKVLKSTNAQTCTSNPLQVATLIKFESKCSLYFVCSNLIHFGPL